MSNRVAVIGGGLAGLASAVRLAARGSAVTLFEARGRLGGATFSFQRDGVTVDNGQHVLLRCYHEYRSFLETIGSAGDVRFQDHFRVPVHDAHRGSAHLARTPRLPAPLHLGPSLARYRPLPVADRIRVLPAVAALRFVDPDDPATDGRAFGEWLVRHGQSPRAVAALWDLVTVAALNTDAASASLALAAKVFRTALLERADAADIGIPGVGLSALHGEPAARYLRAHGCEIRVRQPVRALRADGPGGAGGAGIEVRTDSATSSFDAVVVAVPPESAEQICPHGIAGSARELGSAPIVNVHVRYSRRVLDEPFMAFVSSPVQWVFDRTAVSGVESGQYLTVSVSAARDWIDEPAARVRERFLAELARLLPSARAARVEDFFVTRERRATFRQAPGSSRSRPGARTAVPGLVLAGAWTATGWPDTMEGAVRSGNLAADVVASHVARAAVGSAG